jgi:hypothetical protein
MFLSRKYMSFSFWTINIYLLHALKHGGTMVPFNFFMRKEAIVIYMHMIHCI